MKLSELIRELQDALEFQDSEIVIDWEQNEEYEGLDGIELKYTADSRIELLLFT